MTVERSYLHDTLSELMTRARDAKATAARPADGGDSSALAFQQGRALAYYEVVSHLLTQLDAFGIDRLSVGIDPAYDPERDFL